MKIAFIIISYSNNNFDTLNTCVQSIRKFYKELICIIDNFPSSNKYEGDNIIYYSSNLNLFELGTIWKAYELYQDVDRFIIIHDSVMLINNIPINIYDEQIEFISFWKEKASGYSPVIPWVEKKIFELGLDFEYNKEFYSICGCMCLIDRKILKNLFDIKSNKIIAQFKHEAVGTEILFGYLIKYITKRDIESLHKFPINDYFIGKYNNIWIRKFKSGQGNIVHKITNINNEVI